jgi:hypothetical protein
MVIESTPHEFVQWLLRQEASLTFDKRLIGFEVIDNRTVRILSTSVINRKVVRESIITLVLVPIGRRLEIGWAGGVGEWQEASDKFLDRLGERIKRTWPEAYNDFECYSVQIPSADDNTRKADRIVTSDCDQDQVEYISIQDERIAKIRSMFSGGKSPSDTQIATELIVSVSLAKKLRLQAGIKRRERKKGMS